MQRDRTVALVADDHELFRSGFSIMLKRDCGFGEVIETNTLDEALQVLGERVDITFATLDLAMPGMQSALSLQSVREIFPDLCVAVVTGSRRREDILAALAAGAHGYVLKSWSATEIAEAIQTILSGRIFVPRSLAELPREDFSQAVRNFALPTTPAVHLTQRQQEVLHLIRNGKSNKEIARLLNLTESTVKVHTNGLYRALGVRNRSGAAASRAE
jgi:DNA-binding NarL/FixJ family response regulator